MCRFLDYRGVAEFVGVSEGTARKWFGDRVFPVFKIGRLARVSLEDLETWLQAHRSERPAQRNPAQPVRRGPGRPRKPALQEA